MLNLNMSVNIPVSNRGVKCKMSTREMTKSEISTSACKYTVWSPDN